MAVARERREGYHDLFVLRRKKKEESSMNRQRTKEMPFRCAIDTPGIMRFVSQKPK